jgi:serine/threonine-protein kinase
VTLAATVQTFACPRCNHQNSAQVTDCPNCGNDLRGLGAESDTYDGVALGRVIDDRYMLLAKIGDGGMGSVYRVEHVRMGKVMALKILRQDIARKRSVVDRFRREAKVLSKVDHPNAIAIFDCGATENGLLYLAMEYVPGRDLVAVLREEGRLEERRALKIVVQVLKALTAAHREGIVHRDVKAGNVMLTRSREGESEQVKLLDFGIAKLAQSDRDQNGAGAQITGGADLVGTPSCMSPEQARGQELDARSDIYSTSALLFELLAGRGPFTGGPLEIVSHHLITPAPKIRDVAPEAPISDATEMIVAKGLSKKPIDRWQSADEMRQAIEHLLGSRASHISHEEILNLARREDWDAFETSFKRRHLAMRFFGVLLLVATIAGGYFAYRREGEKPVMRVAVPVELEPNDQPAQASLLEPGRAVNGYIGARTTSNVSDRDFYELNVLMEGVATLEVSAVPNINLVVEVYPEPRGGEEALPIALIDDAPTGMSEEMTDLYLGTGRYFIRLMDKRRLDEPDGPPRENSSDPYLLKVSMAPARTFQEREPNNEPNDAMVVDTNAPVLGRAGTPGIVTVMRAGPAPLPTWSLDQYRVANSNAGTNICAVLGGLRWSTLRLAALTPRANDRTRLKTLGSVQVREGRAGGLCVKATDNLFFEVRVDVGSTGVLTYPLAVVHDKAGGFDGLLSLAKLLPTLDRTAEARLLVERTLDLLPKAEDAVLLKEALRAIPEGESAAVDEGP